MSDAKKIGDARLAEKVIDAYADGLDALTADECKGLGIDGAHCSTLRDVLKTGPEGEVTPDERAELEKSGFAKEFIDGIAGTDGKNALRERVKWLGDHAVKKWWRINYEKDDRARMINEIKSLGSAAIGAVPALIELFKDEDSDVRWEAARALISIGAPVVPALIEALKDECCIVRLYAVATLGNIRLPAVSPFIEALSDICTDVRLEAAFVLDRFGVSAAQAIPALSSALADEDKILRRTAAEVLGKIGKESFPALPFLEEMRDNDPDPDCRKAAGEAVEKIEKEIR